MEQPLFRRYLGAFVLLAISLSLGCGRKSAPATTPIEQDQSAQNAGRLNPGNTTSDTPSAPKTIKTDADIEAAIQAMQSPDKAADTAQLDTQDIDSF